MQLQAVLQPLILCQVCQHCQGCCWKARHSSHIYYRRGRRCQVYHNNAQWFHRASRAKFDFISSDRYHSHDE